MAAWDEMDDAFDQALEEQLAYEELPVLGSDRRIGGDLPSDRHGATFRMGAQVAWSPAREGYDAPPRPPRLVARWKLGGKVVAQSPADCTECGGMVATASDLATRQAVEYAWRSDVDPTIRPLGPDDTCSGCLRQGEAIARRVQAAAVAEAVAEERRASGADPWAWTRDRAKPEAEEGSQTPDH
jgi:hypothetical protein